jgi:ABC-type arginine transport system ATPase subunit
MASSVALIESCATCPPASLKDHSATGPLVWAPTKVGIEIRSQAATETTRFITDLSELTNTLDEFPLRLCGVPQMRME